MGMRFGKLRIWYWGNGEIININEETLEYYFRNWKVDNSKHLIRKSLHIWDIEETRDRNISWFILTWKKTDAKHFYTLLVNEDDLKLKKKKNASWKLI